MSTCRGWGGHGSLVLVFQYQNESLSLSLVCQEGLVCKSLHSMSEVSLLGSNVSESSVSIYTCQWVGGGRGLNGSLFENV